MLSLHTHFQTIILGFLCSPRDLRDNAGLGLSAVLRCEKEEGNMSVEEVDGAEAAGRKRLLVSLLTLSVSTFQPLLLIFNGLQLGLVHVGQRPPLSTVNVQARKHGVDLRVESGKFLQAHTV